MNEQDISNAVKAVLNQMKEKEAFHDKVLQHKEYHHENGHVCKCHKHRLTLDAANALIEKIKVKATEMGVNVVIAVSDRAGRPVVVQCMDGAYIASFDIAINKTYTSASLKMSTEALGHLSQPGQPLYGIQFTNEGKIVIFGGGETLEVDGEIIGALGVSGGSAEEDTAIAAYGKKIFSEIIP